MGMIWGRSDMADGPRGPWRGRRNWNTSFPSRQDSLHKGMAGIKRKEFFVLTKVEGMGDNEKQGQQRRVDQDELGGACILDST